MKYSSALLLFILTTFSVFSQTPEKMSYQAIIRDGDNNLVTDSNVSIKILFHQNAPNGTNVYEETHSITTNNNGLATLEIGTGLASNGNFNTIPWEEGTYFIETQVDITGGSSFNIIGVSQLLSVPFALHAKSAEKIIGPNGTNPLRAEIIPFSNSRSIINSDINNTIACTASATLTLTTGFSSMNIGDTINLEAHNGAVLSIKGANGVTINYTNAGNAEFVSNAGNVRFGLLRKSGQNAYIISGQ
ncbi:hypothetical protein [uncultured Algibacter sp.]|uniref:hypothetical protein n=1 Tax=uncultured Algibacter sp. TaxID=298659 RepID=UPI003216B8CF